MQTKNLATTMHFWKNHLIDDPKQIISAIYEEEVKWKRSFFILPSGTGGKY